MIEYIRWFVCCLHPTEFQVLAYMVDQLVLVLFVGLPVQVWDALWLTVPSGGQKRKDAFLQIYRLHIVTIEATELLPEREVVAPSNLAFWVTLAVAKDEGAFDCSDGCQQSRVGS